MEPSDSVVGALPGADWAYCAYSSSSGWTCPEAWVSVSNNGSYAPPPEPLEALVLAGSDGSSVCIEKSETFFGGWGGAAAAGVVVVVVEPLAEAWVFAVAAAGAADWAGFFFCFLEFLDTERGLNIIGFPTSWTSSAAF